VIPPEDWRRAKAVAVMIRECRRDRGEALTECDYWRRLLRQILRRLPAPQGWIVLLLVTITACAEPLPLNVRDGETVGSLAELPPVVEAACDVIGLECEAVDHEYGAITLDLVRTDERVRGRAGGVGICSPWVWVDPTVERVAHELGHALGLEHRDDEGALMQPAPREDEVELDDDEMDEIERGVNRLVACRL
jgi:hypothetical protein